MTIDIEKMLTEALRRIKERADTGGRRIETAMSACEQIEIMVDNALDAFNEDKAQPQPIVSTDPTYVKDEISGKPEWELAFTLSEIMNDNAPIGWGKYVGPAKCLLDSYIIQRKQKAQPQDEDLAQLWEAPGCFNPQPQEPGEFDELLTWLKSKNGLSDRYDETIIAITTLQARVRELKELYENEKWGRRTAEYPWPQKYDEARAKAQATCLHSYEKDGVQCDECGMLLTKAQSQDARKCTCHPDDNPPHPCPRKFALTECKKAVAQPQEPGESDELVKAIERCAERCRKIVRLDGPKEVLLTELAMLSDRTADAITTLQAQLKELEALYENEKAKRRMAEYPQPQKLGEFDELKKLKRKIADYLDNEDWDDEESLPDIFRECETVITALQARVQELCTILNKQSDQHVAHMKGINEQNEIRLNAYKLSANEATAKALEEAAQVLDDCAQEWNKLRDPGMANQARSYAAKIRALIQTGSGKG
jgi:hypothetical protein